jgi:hypothetical protein
MKMPELSPLGFTQTAQDFAKSFAAKLPRAPEQS